MPEYKRADGTTYYKMSEGMPQRLSPTPETQPREPGAEPEGRYYTDEQGNVHQVEYTLRNGVWDKEDTIVQFAPSTKPTAEAEAQRGYEAEQKEKQRAYEAEQTKGQRTWQEQQTAKEIQAAQARQEQMLGWYREQQTAQLEQERQQRLAQLRANPASWLEYASYAGQTPAIQPWMLPLMPQQYGWQAGQAIPGYQAGGERMNLPTLTTPSAQYQSRVGPTAMAQYGGYEQARTGSRPEETQWRLWQQAPPSGRFPGVRQTR